MTRIVSSVNPSGNGSAAAVVSPPAQLAAVTTYSQPYFQIGLDATYGLHISSIGCGAFQQLLQPTWLWRGVVRTVATGARTVINNNDLVFVSQSITGGVTAFNFTYGGWLTLQLTISVADGRIYFGANITETGTAYSLECHEWPRCSITPYSSAADTYFFNPVYAGGIVKEPSSASQGIVTLTAPSAMQCCGVYDATTRHQLYFQSDDETGYYKQYTFKGTGSAFNIWWTHYPVDSHTPGKGTHSIPYRFWCEPLVGRGSGWTGFVDTCDRYRRWALDPARTFLPADTWKDSTVITSHAKNEKVFIVPTPNTDEGASVVAELTAVVAKLGITDIRAHIYLWHDNAFDHDWPAMLPVKAWAPAAVKSLRDLGIKPLIYTINVYWNQTNGDQHRAGQFDFYDFDTFGDISDAVFCDDAGNPVVAPEPDDATFVAFDTSRGRQIAARLTELFATSPDWLVGGEPSGCYMDQISGAGTPVAAVIGPENDIYVLRFNQLPSLSPRGNNGLYSAGKAATVDLVRTALPGRVLTGESIEERLLGKFDFMHAWSEGYPRERGISVHGFGRVYGQYQRLADLAVTIYPTAALDFVLLYTLMITISLHYGMPLCWNHIPQLNPLFKDNPSPSSGQGLIIYWIQLLLASWPYFKKYHEGELLRPLDGSFFHSYYTSGTTLIPWWSSNGSASLPLTSVWRCPEDGDIGIIITTDWPGTTTDVVISMDNLGWPLPAGAKGLYRNDAGVRTLITSFNNALNHTVQVTGPGVYVYEIALLP